MDSEGSFFKAMRPRRGHTVQVKNESEFTPLTSAFVASAGKALVNTLNADLNPICHLLALLGAHHIFHVSRIKVYDIKSSRRSPFYRLGNAKFAHRLEKCYHFSSYVIMSHIVLFLKPAATRHCL